MQPTNDLAILAETDCPEEPSEQQRPRDVWFFTLSILAVCAAAGACLVALTTEHWSALLLGAAAMLLISQTIVYRSYSPVLGAAVALVAAASGPILLID